MRILILILSLWCSIFAFGHNTAPLWCSDTWRTSNYPHELYVKGFVVGELQSGESIEQVLQRIKEKAQAEAIQNITTSVEYTSVSMVQSDQQIGTMGFSEMTRELFSTSTTIHSTLKDIPNLSVESWHNAKTNEVFAFAWVKKTDLARTLKKQIISHVTRAEMAIEEAEGLLAEGEKSAARKSIARAIEYLQQVEEQQKVVQSVDSNTDMEDIAFTESNALKQRAAILYQQLRNGVFVYIGGEVTIFGKAYPTFIQQINHEISSIGCAFTTTESDADWVIHLQGTTREYNTLQTGNYIAYFVLAEVALQIMKGNTQSTIYEGSFSEKGSHTLNREEAGYAAYAEVHHQIAAKIKEIINN